MYTVLYVDIMEILNTHSNEYILVVIPWSDVLHFFTGVQINGIIDMRTRTIARVYMKTWFPPDLAILSVDLSVFIMSSSARYGGSLRLIRALRMVSTITE